MEFLRLVKRRSLLSEVAYVGLNVALAVVIFVLILSVQNTWLPLGIALLSKWRILAVRPRYWWANIQSNLVDIIVTTGYVILLAAAQGTTTGWQGGSVAWLQVVLMLLFIGWLLLIKPRSSRRMMGVQALIAIFLGTTGVAISAYSLDSIIMVAIMWLIGYASARHFLTACDTDQISLFSLAWGFILAELGWLGYHWLFVYSVFGTANIKIVQIALIVTLLSFLVGRAIDMGQQREIRPGDLLLPATFTFGLIVVLLFAFNNLSVVGSI